MSYGDGFFDSPAGYSDADLEMAALEDAGNRYSRRYIRRGLGTRDVSALRDGESVRVDCKSKETGERYTVAMRALDCDEIGPCDFTYSYDGREWFASAREARAAVQA